MSPEHLLGEVEDVIRTMPPGHTLDHGSPDILEWSGRACAVMNEVGVDIGIFFHQAIDGLDRPPLSGGAVRDVQRILHQARYSLRMKTLGPVNLAMGAGAVFDYFDEVRKVIETASSDLLFVDPYLDSEFVSRYLPHVKLGVPVRLLTVKGISTLVPAATLFAQQTGLQISVRSSGEMHDRFVIVDGTSGFQSGASFNHGAKKAPTTLTQITDAFAVVRQQYEDRWIAGSVHL